MNDEENDFFEILTDIDGNKTYEGYDQDIDIINSNMGWD